MSEIETLDAVVVGGGVAGLVAAYRLSQNGLAVTVFEARGRPGGLVFGDDLGGITVDLGAESFAKRVPAAAALCRELGLEVLDPVGQSWIWSHRPSPDHPDGLPGYAFKLPHGVLGIPSSLDDPGVLAALSPAGLARARHDLTMGPEVGADCADMASLVETRLGREVLDRLVTPVAGGVHSADPSLLAVDVIAPGLRQRMRDEGSLVRAAAAQRRSAPPGAIVSSVAGGLYRLPAELSRRITAAGGDIWTKTLVTGITRDGDDWLVTIDAALDAGEPHQLGAPAGEPFTLRTPRLIVALDGRPALEMLRPLTELTIGDWMLPQGADLAAVDVSIDNPSLDVGPRGSGLLVTPPACDDEPRVRCKALTHYSIKWPWVREKQPLHVLRLSYPDPTWASVSQAVADASVLLGVELDLAQVRGSHVVRFPNGLPPHTPAHRARVAELQVAARQLPGFAVTGAWVAGSGLAHVIPHAEQAADIVRG